MGLSQEESVQIIRAREIGDGVRRFLVGRRGVGIVADFTIPFNDFGIDIDVSYVVVDLVNAIVLSLAFRFLLQFSTPFHQHHSLQVASRPAGIWAAKPFHA